MHKNTLSFLCTALALAFPFGCNSTTTTAETQVSNASATSDFDRSLETAASITSNANITSAPDTNSTAPSPPITTGASESNAANSTTVQVAETGSDEDTLSWVGLDAGTDSRGTDAGFVTNTSTTGDALSSFDASSHSAPLDTDTAPLPELTIASDTASIEFTPALYAAENLYPGVAEVITGGIPVLLSDDDVDLGTNAETQTLRRSVERPDLRIIFTVTETFYRIIARRSAGITTLADLADKRIGTPAQTSAAFYVFKTLSLAGLKIGQGAGQVRVSSLFPGEGMVTALAGTNPSVDAVAAWEPYPQLALDALGGTSEQGDGIVFQDREVYREIVNLHSTEAKLADPTIRRGIVAFVRTLIQAAEWYRSNPALAQSFVADTLGHEPELMERVWEDERFGGVLAPDLLDVLEEEEVWLANEENRTPRTRDELAPLIDDSVVAEAVSRP